MDLLLDLHLDVEFDNISEWQLIYIQLPYITSYVDPIWWDSVNSHIFLSYLLWKAYHQE